MSTDCNRIAYMVLLKVKVQCFIRSCAATPLLFCYWANSCDGVRILIEDNWWRLTSCYIVGTGNTFIRASARISFQQFSSACRKCLCGSITNHREWCAAVIMALFASAVCFVQFVCQALLSPQLLLVTNLLISFHYLLKVWYSNTKGPLDDFSCVH